MIVQAKKYRIPILLLLFGVISCIIFGIVSIDSEENWFARSGAILSFVSVAVPFILSNLKKVELEKLVKMDIRLQEKIELVKKKDKMHEAISISSIATGLIGTIIWGYGDLFY